VFFTACQASHLQQARVGKGLLIFPHEHVACVLRYPSIEERDEQVEQRGWNVCEGGQRVMTLTSTITCIAYLNDILALLSKCHQQIITLGFTHTAMLLMDMSLYCVSILYQMVCN
jgi:hypothetical protein